MNKMKYFFMLLTILSMGCKSTQTTDAGVDVETEVVAEEEVTGCKTLGTVKDITGLDGCGLMIVLENGKRVDPVVIEDKNFKLRDGQRIRFTYEQEREVMSICMNGQTVRVTCIEEVN